VFSLLPRVVVIVGVVDPVDKAATAQCHVEEYVTVVHCGLSSCSLELVLS